MMRILFLTAVVLVQSAAEEPITSSYVPKENPITKVITLLTELKEKTVADGKAEEATYNKMACWCETTTKNKAEEIAAAKAQIEELGQAINSNKGSIAELAADIHDLTSDIATNEAKQYEETTRRERQNADYMQNKAELQNAMDALDKAVQMLQGVDMLSLLQGKTKMTSTQVTTLQKLKPAVLKVVDRLPSGNKLTNKQLSALESVSKVGSKDQYQPFEPTVTQILKDLLESFRSTADTETTNEKEAQDSYDAMMESKSNELETKKGLLMEKQAARSKEEKDMTANEAIWQSTADQMVMANKVFQGAKEACTFKAEEWEVRKKLREEEIDGMEKALATLSSDDAKALIGKASKDGGSKLDFVQLASVRKTHGNVRKAYLALRKVATKIKSTSVAKIATKVMEHSLQKSSGDADWQADVIADITGILEELKADQETDTETYDLCKEEEHSLQLVIDNKTHIVKRYGWKIDKLDTKVEDIQAEIIDAGNQILALKEMMKELTDERKKENEEFEAEKADDEGAVKILSKAMDQLSKFYDDEGVPVKLMQEDESADDDSEIFLQKKTGHQFLGRQPEFAKSDMEVIKGIKDHKFSKKSSRKTASKGIIGLLTLIKEDLEQDIAQGVAEEEEAEAEFQKLMTDSKAEKKELEEKSDDLRDDKADTESDIEDNKGWKKDEEELLASKVEEMRVLQEDGDEGKDISIPCEFLMRTYHVRRKQREAEAEGMNQALAYLQGKQD